MCERRLTTARSLAQLTQLATEGKEEGRGGNAPLRNTRVTRSESCGSPGKWQSVDSALARAEREMSVSLLPCGFANQYIIFESARGTLDRGFARNKEPNISKTIRSRIYDRSGLSLAPTRVPTAATMESSAVAPEATRVFRMTRDTQQRSLLNCETDYTERRIKYKRT